MLCMISGIIEKISDEDKNLEVEQAVLGLGYVAVTVGGRTGVSASLREHLQPGCSAFAEAGRIRGRSAGELLAMGSDILSRSLTLATINALVADTADDGDAFGQIEAGPGDRVLMVGMIEPLFKRYGDKRCEAVFFEQRKMEHPRRRDAEELPACFGEADLIILTATTLINGSFNELLALENHAREVVLAGPSTPMKPELFAGSGVSWLAGAAVNDGDLAARIIMEGGGTKPLYKYGALRKVSRRVAR